MSQSSPDALPEVPAIEFRNVSIEFDAKPVLEDISFALQSGEMIAVTGAAGSGKSVLLHLAIALLKPDSGEILIQGQRISDLTETELLATRSEVMGLAFQEEALFTAMTVYENAAYRLREHGWPDDRVDVAVGEILRFVGLGDDAYKMPEELSVGMRRRLEAARALAGWPTIMLFDEPTGGLDPVNNRQMLDLIIRARDVHAISSLYVTKELHEIPYLGSHRARVVAGGVEVKEADELTRPEFRVLVLDEGGLAFLGTLSEFQATKIPAVVRLVSPESSSPIASDWNPNPWKNRGSGHRSIS
ncbi:MAG TPA: ATP-binding cassette domain-containing protein [Blastocatellia bacterium]|nr:ATP-binding cassette domain-containing protein [Blastocatellia bacterium]